MLSGGRAKNAGAVSALLLSWGLLLYSLPAPIHPRPISIEAPNQVVSSSPEPHFPSIPTEETSPPFSLPSFSPPPMDSPSGEMIPVSPSPTPSGIIVAPMQDYRDALNAPFLLPAKLAPRGGEALTRPRHSGVCSAGSYVTDRNNDIYLLTAAHCGRGVYATGLGRIIGVTKIMSQESDLQGIRVSKGSDRIRLFNKSLPLVGIATVKPGDRVCRSGAVSGTICNQIVLDSSEYTLRFSDGDEHRHLVRIRAAGPKGVSSSVGDSGGPVFTVRDGEAFLVGFQIGGYGKVPCGDVASSECFHESYVEIPTEFMHDNRLSLYAG